MATLLIGERLAPGRKHLSQLRPLTAENWQQDYDLYRSGLMSRESLEMAYTPASNPICLFRHTEAALPYIREYQENGNWEAIIEATRHNLITQIIATHNIRTNAGGIQQALRMGSASGAAANFMGLSATTTGPGTAITPAPADTTLAGETAASGLARGAADSFTAFTITTAGNSTTSSIGTYKLAKTWTNNSGVIQYIQGLGVFDAVTAGNMWFEAPVTVTQLGLTDSLTLTYTVTI